ncbi:MAG: hypothetical protein OCC49_13015 [Fibrobacterales bacterium]
MKLGYLNLILCTLIAFGCSVPERIVNGGVSSNSINTGVSSVVSSVSSNEGMSSVAPNGDDSLKVDSNNVDSLAPPTLQQSSSSEVAKDLSSDTINVDSIPVGNKYKPEFKHEPLASDTVYVSTIEDVPEKINVLVSDKDNSTTLVLSILDSGHLGIMEVLDSNTLNYTPHPNANGVDLFLVAVTDGLYSDSIYFKIDIEARTDAPLVKGSPKIKGVVRPGSTLSLEGERECISLDGTNPGLQIKWKRTSDADEAILTDVGGSETYTIKKEDVGYFFYVTLRCHGEGELSSALGFSDSTEIVQAGITIENDSLQLPDSLSLGYTVDTLRATGAYQNTVNYSVVGGDSLGIFAITDSILTIADELLFYADNSQLSEGKILLKIAATDKFISDTMTYTVDIEKVLYENVLCGFGYDHKKLLDIEFIQFDSIDPFNPILTLQKISVAQPQEPLYFIERIGDEIGYVTMGFPNILDVKTVTLTGSRTKGGDVSYIGLKSGGKWYYQPYLIQDYVISDVDISIEDFGLSEVKIDSLGIKIVPGVGVLMDSIGYSNH